MRLGVVGIIQPLIPLSWALKLVMTPQDINLRLSSHETANLFRSLDLEVEATRNALIGLLQMEEFHFQYDYGMMKIDVKLADALTRHFSGRPELHELLLPFRLYRERPLQVALGLLTEYHPIILLGDRFDYLERYTDAQLSLALSHAISGQSPLNWSSWIFLLKMLDMGYKVSWEVPPALAKETLYNNIQTHGAFLAFLDIVCPFVSGSLSVDLVDSMVNAGLLPAEERMWKLIRPLSGNAYPSFETVQGIVALVFGMTASLPEKAFFHAKIVYCAARGLFTRLNYDEVRELVAYFVEKHAVENMPIFCIRRLMFALRGRLEVEGTFVKAIPGQLEKLSKLDRIYPTGPCIIADLGGCIAKWRFNLRIKSSREEIPLPSCQSCTLNEAIRWWGNFRSLANVLLQDPKAIFPISELVASDGTSCACSTIEAFLIEFSRLLYIETRLFTGTFEVIIGDIDDSLLYRAFVRTLTANILYRQTIGFDIGSGGLDQLYRHQWLRTDGRYIVFKLLRSVNFSWLPIHLFESPASEVLAGLVFVVSIFLGLLC
jgi:hypothetical protein